MGTVLSVEEFVQCQNLWFFCRTRKKKHGRPTVEKSRQHFSMFRKYLDPVRFFKRPNLCIAGRIIFLSIACCLFQWLALDLCAKLGVFGFFFFSPLRDFPTAVCVCAVHTAGKTFSLLFRSEIHKAHIDWRMFHSTRIKIKRVQKSERVRKVNFNCFVYLWSVTQSKQFDFSEQPMKSERKTVTRSEWIRSKIINICCDFVRLDMHSSKARFRFGNSIERNEQLRHSQQIGVYSSCAVSMFTVEKTEICKQNTKHSHCKRPLDL